MPHRQEYEQISMRYGERSERIHSREYSPIDTSRAYRTGNLLFGVEKRAPGIFFDASSAFDPSARKEHRH